MTAFPVSLSRFLRFGAVLVCSWVAGAPAVPAAARDAGADPHTVALWLFDEPMYPNVVLTDASGHGYDLRLQSAYAKWLVETEGKKGEPPAEPLHVAGKYGLVAGRYGRAVYVPDAKLAQVTFVDNRQRYSSASVLGRGSAVPERLNLGYFDWTIEFWFKAKGNQDVPADIFVLRNERDYPRGLAAENALRLLPGRREFALTARTVAPSPSWVPGDVGATYSIDVRIPTNPAVLGDGAWHHVAFTYTASERQVRHAIDGRMQTLPEKGGFLPMLGVLTQFGFGSGLNALLDEYRISNVVRYRAPFTPPESFSRNYGPEARPPNRPNGPPLLFGADSPRTGVVPLGSRKHVFIDGALVETSSNLSFQVHPPTGWEETDFRNTSEWEATPRFGSTIPDVVSVWDDGGAVRMLYTNGGMWGGKDHVFCLAESRDGIHWTKPVLRLHPWDGDLATNIVIPDAGQGALIRDTNPAAPDAERYKLISWSYYRGYYLYTSPDAIHFTRNETVGLPFDTDGSATFFWDDQRGFYHAYFRCVSQDRSIGRRAGHDIIEDLFKPWPFKPVDRPWIDDLMLARPALGELPIIDTGGQVYRMKARKYEWAPDVYVAFPWRYVGSENIRPGSFLMVSRDGTNWTIHEKPYYFAGGWEHGGHRVEEALMEDGMVRRGSELWQYGTIRFTEHGGALYGGVEHDGGVHDRLLRLHQRLDGFVAAEPAGDGRGVATLVTRPLTFAGDHLELNVDASGGVAKVELQDSAGQALPGFALSDCVAIREDGTALTVLWKSGAAAASFAGRPVRVKIELTNARLYALQFR